MVQRLPSNLLLNVPLKANEMAENLRKEVDAERESSAALKE